MSARMQDEAPAATPSVQFKLHIAWGVQQVPDDPEMVLANALESAAAELRRLGPPSAGGRYGRDIAHASGVVVGRWEFSWS